MCAHALRRHAPAATRATATPRARTCARAPRCDVRCGVRQTVTLRSSWSRKLTTGEGRVGEGCSQTTSEIFFFVQLVAHKLQRPLEADGAATQLD